MWSLFRFRPRGRFTASLPASPGAAAGRERKHRPQPARVRTRRQRQAPNAPHARAPPAQGRAFTHSRTRPSAGRASGLRVRLRELGPRLPALAGAGRAVGGDRGDLGRRAGRRAGQVGRAGPAGCGGVGLGAGAGVGDMDADAGSESPPAERGDPGLTPEEDARARAEFAALHGPALRASGVPERYWGRLLHKLEHEVRARATREGEAPAGRTGMRGGEAGARSALDPSTGKGVAAGGRRAESRWVASRGGRARCAGGEAGGPLEDSCLRGWLGVWGRSRESAFRGWRSLC